MVIPKLGIDVMLWLNTFHAVICWNDEFQLVVIGSGSHDHYQSCPEFYNDCARKISAFLHIRTESYGIFSRSMPAVQTARQNLGNGIFRAS